MKRQALRLIPAVHRAVHRIGLALAAGDDPRVTQAEAHILAHLAESAGAATVAALHTALAHRRSTLTSILDRLEQGGLVRRAPAPGDRRSVLITLTAAGERAAAAVHRHLAALERRALAGLSEREQRVVARVVEALGRA